MPNTVISITLTSIVITMLLQFLLRNSVKSVTIDKDGNQVFRLPQLFSLLGIIFIALTISFIIYGLVMFEHTTILDIAAVSGVGLLFGIPLILAHYVLKVTLTNEHIIAKNIIGKEKRIRWVDIKSINFNESSQELIIKSEISKIRCSKYLTGFDTLVTFVSTMTNIPVAAMGLK